MIDAKENALSPQSIGMKLPRVDPTKTPIHINVFADMCFKYTLYVPHDTMRLC